MKIVLTAEQWAAFGRDVMDDPQRSALQACCGNISALRDVILRVRDREGELPEDLRRDLAQKWDWCRSGHEFNEVRYPVWLTLKSLIEQSGLPWDEVQP